MYSRYLSTFISILLLVASSVVYGQIEDVAPAKESSRQGRHAIELNAGLLSSYGVETDVSAGATSSSVGGDGFMGGLGYHYWIKEELAIGVSVGVLDSEVSTSVSGAGVLSETSSVVPILFRLKYQPAGMRLSKNVRPFLFGAIGASIASGTQAGTGPGFSSGTFTESVLSSHFGIGTEFELSRLFVAGLTAGYFLAADFDRVIGGQRNYSSPQFTLFLGIMLGSGKK